MPVNRQSDQMIGADLNQVLVPSASYATGTYHIGYIQQAGAGAVLGLKTGATALPDVLASAGKYLDLVIDVTVPNGGTVTATIQGVDPTSGKVFTILASTALAAAATTVLRVGPTYTVSVNLIALDFIPLTWNVQVVVATAAVTFSIGALQMP